MFVESMHELISSEALLVQLDGDSRHAEGPVYIPSDGSVVWSDVKGDRMLRWHDGSVSVFREPSHFQNGNALDLEGRIVACSHGDRAIVRQAKEGQWRVLVDRYQGKRLNSPNDLVVKSDGTLWFTDPPFGLTQPEEGCGGQQEQSGSFVFRFDPGTGEINAVITDMERPNGLAFSPDETLLYVSDTSAVERPQMCHDIRVYDIINGRKAANMRMFAVVKPGQPDGFCVDAKGNIFTSSQDSVQIYSPAGELLGKIPIPEVCTNVTFGGVNRDHLFITTSHSLYRIKTKTRGAC
ncbi:SMP-30/Gluconolaconase/LRE-like region superfamily [Synechococcus sp. PCC 7335]|nr:SMP-30/Gluconolaconase/LRE-like region superfamily [Synechococcus sp. PCC 7335]